MKVFGVNPIGLLTSFFGWTHIAIHDNVVWVLGVSMIGMVVYILGWLFNRSFYRRQDQLSRAVYREERDVDSRSCLEGDISNSSSEGMRNDPILEPKHKIFLSHSGAQKEFVDYLCKALEDRFHYPFFDRRNESLPKGEQFPELIVRAAKQCEMLIVVVSDEYFMSKWPMIELNAFVRAHKFHHESRSSRDGPKILPLFYGLSVRDLEDASNQKKWFRKWESLAKFDPKNRLNLSDWKDAFHTLRSFNGLPYDRNSKEVVAYLDKIVSNVCNSIASDIKWDDSHVQGKSTICKVIGDKIEGLGVSQKYQVKVVGIYGISGIGKTTTCKTLCNELSSKYEGRVCHIEFPSGRSFDSKEFFQKVVMGLTKKNMEVIGALDGGQCKDVLRKSLFKQRTFLAIDNISDSHQSMLEAKTLLKFSYYKDSLVVVTARSQSVLERLGLDEDACFEMPDLEEADAMNLFLYHAIGGKQFFVDQERDAIMTCIKRCYFSKGNGQGHHYHALALQALGVQLGLYGEDPCEWVRKLAKVNSFNDFPGENLVFDILRGSFDMLSREDQTLFVDIGFFARLGFGCHLTMIKWLCTVHKQDEEALLLRVECIKRKGIVCNLVCDGKFDMHDLFLEFAELETSGSSHKFTNSWEPMWLHVENGDLSDLEGDYWHKLIRLSIGQFNSNFGNSLIPGWIEGMEGLKWDSFSHVQVLYLASVHWGHGVWNLEGLIQLRVLHLSDVYEIDGVEGLDKLKHLTCFSWTWDLLDSNDYSSACIVGQLPSSLKQLDIWGVQVTMGLDAFLRCKNLSTLQLHHVEIHSLDLNNCSSLESVQLRFIKKLRTLSIGAICLQSLCIHHCKSLVDIFGIDHLFDLKKLSIYMCPKWKVPRLLALTKLQVLTIDGQRRLLASTNDCFPQQLQELYWRGNQIGSRLNLTRFNQLEVLDLSNSHILTSLARMGDLPTLQHLNLSGCTNLLRLPTLSTSRNLKKLNLDKCLALELHKEDIQMLCELPMLQPVPFSKDLEFSKCRLDFARKKMLVHFTSIPPDTWELRKVDGWYEYDLDTLHLYTSGHLGT